MNNNYSINHEQIGRLDKWVIVRDENNVLYLLEDEDNIINPEDSFDLNECKKLSSFEKKIQYKVKKFVGDIYE